MILTVIPLSRRWDHDPPMKPYSVFKKGGHGHSHDHAHVGMKMSESEEEEEYYNSKGVGSGGHDHEEAEDQKRLEVTSPFLGRTDGLLSLYNQTN